MKKYGEEVVVHVLGFSEMHNDTFLNELSLMVTIVCCIHNSTTISEINSITPLMGDHKIITATLGETKPQPKITERRSWKNYSKTGLLELLKEVKFDLEINTVQELCNEIEIFSSLFLFNQSISKN